MSIVLSSDSDAFLCVLYAEYLNRRSHHVPIDEARSFPSSESIRESFLPDWLDDDVYTVCQWLSSRGLISCLLAETSAFDISITEDGIIYMESRFSRQRESVVNRLVELSSLGVSIAGALLGK